MRGSVQFSYYINNRQPNGSLSNVLSRLAQGLAVGVRVDGDDETQRKELSCSSERRDCDETYVLLLDAQLWHPYVRRSGVLGVEF